MENGVIVNPDKHHAMVPGSFDLLCSFTINDSVHLLEIKFVKKVNNQLNAMTRFSNLVSTSTMLKL